jgi:hypothetical protein
MLRPDTAGTSYFKAATHHPFGSPFSSAFPLIWKKMMSFG